MVPQPEQHAWGNIDTLLTLAGWQVCDPEQVNLTAHRGVAIREFPLPGHGFADYLLYIDGKAAGVIEAKKEGVTLTGVETQAEKYTQGLPTALPRWSSPLPFSYPSTGIETRFTNGLDPTPRSRPVFAFHKPETLADFLEVGRIKERSDESANAVAEATATYNAHGQTFLARREDRSNETGAQLLQRILETRRSQWKGKGKYKEPAVPDTTDLPELPEGWVWATVGQLGAIKGGKRLPAGHVYAEGRTPCKIAVARRCDAATISRSSVLARVVPGRMGQTKAEECKQAKDQEMK